MNLRSGQEPRPSILLRYQPHSQPVERDKNISTEQTSLVSDKAVGEIAACIQKCSFLLPSLNCAALELPRPFKQVLNNGLW